MASKFKFKTQSANTDTSRYSSTCPLLLTHKTSLKLCWACKRSKDGSRVLKYAIGLSYRRLKCRRASYANQVSRGLTDSSTVASAESLCAKLAASTGRVYLNTAILSECAPVKTALNRYTQPSDDSHPWTKVKCQSR